jgi:hypothetical protein
MRSSALGPSGSVKPPAGLAASACQQSKYDYSWKSEYIGEDITNTGVARRDRFFPFGSVGAPDPLPA